MDTTPRFAMPMIMAAQAQKHLTHNEALAQLETLVQPVVQDLSALTPPTSPNAADCVIVGDGATDAFAGKDGDIATWIADAWHFHTPQAGWMVVLASDGRAYVFSAGEWGPLAAPPVQDNLGQIGINTQSSTTNRLAVASDASLFTASANNHRVTINKAGLADTASLVFKSGWSGRAEIGLSGDDRFALKVSKDGSTWHEALSVNPDGGHVSLPGRPVAVAYLDGGTRSFASGDVTGFSGITRSQGGLGLGTALAAPATGASLSINADGLYQITLSLKADTLGAITLVKNGQYDMATWDAGLSYTGGHTATLSTVLDLYKGDALTLRFDANATCYCYQGTTTMDVISL
jgi:hypothetical protein